MANILVSGLINLETTLQISEFPVQYRPVQYPFFGVNTNVSGVGYNVGKALTRLGNRVNLLSFVGADAMGGVALSALDAVGIPATWVLSASTPTAQSVILYDDHGTRAIYSDLKGIQDLAYPVATFEQGMEGCEIAVLSNINFSRPLLSQARAAGKIIITDVHAISELADPYNQAFMAAAHVLFLSNANLRMPEDDFARAIQAQYDTPIIVIGMGEQGALLAVKDDDYLAVHPAVYARPVVNTVGAGDALLAAFTHAYNRLRDPYKALEQAQWFAAYKIGVTGGAEGFLTQLELDALIASASSHH
jgi:ribokinase